MMAFHRQGDASKKAWTIAGFLLIVGAGILRFTHTIGSTESIVCLVLGAGMLRPDFVVDVVRVWRKKDDPPK